jgi:HK97 gp10 family phage protein
MAIQRSGMTATLDGSQQLQRLLKDFPERIQRDIVNRTARAGATLLRKEMRKNLKQNGSIDSRNLYNSLSVKKVKGEHGKYYIYTRRPLGSHAHLVEFGTGPRKLKKPIPFQIAPDEWITLEHTGSMPAKPFFRPALDEKQVEALQRMQETMAKNMARIAEKMSQEYRTLSKTFKRKLAK